MILERSSSVIRRLRPCPPRSSSPCRPERLKRCYQHRTVFWLQSSSTAIAGTRSPDQPSSIIRARITASRAAFRARDRRRTMVRSSSSRPGRARKTIVQHPPPSTINHPATTTYTHRKRNPALARPPAMTKEQVRHARDLLTRPGNTVTSIAELLGVSRNTIYKYVPELKGGRVALAEATATAELPRPAKSSEWTGRLRLVTAFLPAPQVVLRFWGGASRRRPRLVTRPQARATHKRAASCAPGWLVSGDGGEYRWLVDQDVLGERRNGRPALLSAGDSASGDRAPGAAVLGWDLVGRST
ncbi:helix-turn-helix domain-containing protein [Streptomyces spectabilis]|uniref:helix-turn-helix domain-containing protein n=1 Tax=Streptomyces spectabilis TaxID=68270 RepID=UPI00298F2BBC|nr:helix-turn-helix domain-containing protein [Streptomyces spectabilis]